MAGGSPLTQRLDTRFASRAVRKRSERGGPDDLGQLRHTTESSPDLVRALREHVDHIVILMMENHSYDSYFGTLRDAAGGPRGEGFSLDGNGNPSNTNPGATGSVVVADSHQTLQSSGVPSQSWRASHLQWHVGAMDGFVQAVAELDGSAEQKPMSYWTAIQLPFYDSLAETFPVADHWHCSCLGPTFPNRRFLISGTAHGLMDDVLTGMFDEPKNGTIFSLMTASGVSWNNYHHVRRLRLVSRRLFGKLGIKTLRAIAGVLARMIPGVWSYARGRMQFTANLYPAGLLRCLEHLPEIGQFFDDAKNGTLPAVSIVDPDFGLFSEENPQDIQLGESFAADVINAVMAGPGWPRTILIWTYDEHGGYYDHVGPPDAVPPDGVEGHCLLDTRGPFGWLIRRSPFWKKLRLADDWPMRTYERLGVRVPAVIVSPFAKRDYVATRTYDHTSILRLIEDRWNLPPLTKRDGAAEAPYEALDFSGQGAFASPPQLTGPARPGAWRKT